MILFKNPVIDTDNNTQFSEIIYIPRGHFAEISVFNMVHQASIKDGVLVSEDCLIVHKVHFDNEKEIIADCGCNSYVNLQRLVEEALRERRMWHEVVCTNGEAWVIGACDNIKIIPISGFFMLSMPNPDQLKSSLIKVDVRPDSEGAMIPESLKLGN